MLKTRRIVTKCQTPSQLESAVLFTRYESSNKTKRKVLPQMAYLYRSKKDTLLYHPNFHSIAVASK